MMMQSSVQHEGGTGWTKEDCLVTKDLKLAFWILRVWQPEKSGEVSVISIETDMEKGLLDICGQA